MYRLFKIGAVLGTVFVIGFVVGSVDTQLDLERKYRGAGPGWRR